nr:odorant receptor 11 [Psyttalia incisi]
MDVNSSEITKKENSKLWEYEKYTWNVKYWMLFIGTWLVSNLSIFCRTIPIIAIISTIVLSIMRFRFATANITRISLMVKGFSRDKLSVYSFEDSSKWTTPAVHLRAFPLLLFAKLTSIFPIAQVYRHYV